MSKRIISNIFSNWANLAATVIIAFLVSPIMVNCLGKELYGVWVLIISVTGYFTVLDFGVNTAIVRYISSSAAQSDYVKAQRIYSTSIAIFGVTAIVILIFSLIFGKFIQDIFKINNISHGYLYAVFIISALDLAFGLVSSVLLGTLTGLQEFKFINATSLIINILKSCLLVYMLKGGHGLLTLAIMQISATASRAVIQKIYLKYKYTQIKFSSGTISRDTIKTIYSYSVYSFIIAIALKLLFYTDSVVIGAVIGVSEVTYYAIPSTLLDYLEKFVWAMIAVLIPVISANDATNNSAGNPKLYIVGTRYTLMISMPVVISLYYYGDDFLTLWMGSDFGVRSQWVLKILLVGFGVSFSQLIAHGILKGTSRHRVLAYILAIEALANLGLSLILAPVYGIEGVAVGTMVPLLLASIAIIIYTCKVLRTNIFRYIVNAYAGACIGLIVTIIYCKYWGNESTNYLELLINCTLLTIIYWIVAFPLTADTELKGMIYSKVRKLCCR